MNLIITISLITRPQLKVLRLSLVYIYLHQNQFQLLLQLIKSAEWIQIIQILYDKILSLSGHNML